MSKWRDRGYVQDSDGEDEDIDTFCANPSRPIQNARIQRVASASPIPTSTLQRVCLPSRRDEIDGDDDTIENVSTQPTSLGEENHPSPTLPSIASLAIPGPQREPTESPDPLQPWPLQDFSKNRSREAPLGERTAKIFNLEFLSNTSDSDLSDPPTDDEPPEFYTLPHRRTEVEIVISRSTALERNNVVQRPARSFRERKPIQLHPYLLEGERYRQECQNRGINPVPRLRSPPRHPTRDDAETQEQEFDLENDSPSSSPPDPISFELFGQRPLPNERHNNPTSRDDISHTRTALHSPIGRKRRKLNHSTPRQHTSSRSLERNNKTSDNAIRSDVWAIPQSPPYTSSPLVQDASSVARGVVEGAAHTRLPSLPTPSNSSLPDNLQLGRESSSDPDILRTRRAGRFQLIPLSSDSSSSSPENSDNEANQSEGEVRRIKRRIKGVLPASWLRLDRRAQEKKMDTRQRSESTQSPEKTQPQRGVAHRTSKPTKTSQGRSLSGNQLNELIVISDESENETDTLVSHVGEVQRSAQEASELAAIFDNRYADDDLAGMENDRLPLFTLGAEPRRRKRQLKIKDAFKKSKKPKFLDDGPRGARVSGASRQPRANSQVHRKPAGYRRRGWTPPDLSIIDIEETPSECHGALPQFIRVAMRRARKVPDRSRQSPRGKHVRLHTLQDTEDANVSLQQWRKGAWKPKENSQLRGAVPQRQPLADRIDNQQIPFSLLDDDDQLSIEQGTLAKPDAQLSWQQMRHVPAPGAKLSVKASSPASRKAFPEAGSSASKKKALHSVTQNPSLLRNAQLEGLESDFGKTHRKIAFQRGIQRVEQQSTQQPPWQHSTNVQLARFLADDDTVLPPLLSAADVENGKKSLVNEQARGRKRPLVRKRQAQRIDVDTREYRQPSEPAPIDIINNGTADNETETSLILHGLGPYGTRYPTTFDVLPLALGTYFHPRTFVGGEELHQSLQVGGKDLDSFRGKRRINYGSITIDCGPWNDETYSRISTMLDSIWIPSEDQTVIEAEQIDRQRIAMKELSTSLRSFINYLSSGLSFLDAIDRQDFVRKTKQLVDTQFAKVIQVHLNDASRVDSSSQDSHTSVRAMTYLLVISNQAYQIAKHSVLELSIQEGWVPMIARIAKAIVRYLIGRGASELADFLEKNKRYKERENGIQEKDTLVECLVICTHVLDSSNISRLAFWDLVSQELSTLVGKADQVKTFESVWATALTLLPFTEVDSCGVLDRKRKSAFDKDNWTFIKDLLKRLFALYPGSKRTHSSSLDDYVRANLTRCLNLIDTWHWRRCDPIFGIVFDLFGKNGLRQLQHEESKGSPSFLEQLGGQPSLQSVPSDSAFHIFLKCLALGLRGMREFYTEKKIRSIVFRCTPNHGRSYPKDQSLDSDSLDALHNHHNLLCTLYWASPPSCRPKLNLIRALVQHEDSHREACRLNVRAWGNLAVFQLSVDEPYTSLQPFAEWHKDIILQTLKQYRLAKTEAEDYLKTIQLDGTSDASSHMVRSTMAQNQEQVITTLRDCIAGMLRAVKHSTKQTHLRNFLVDSGVIQLLELPHLDDSRLTIVIRETLTIFRELAYLEKRSSAEAKSQRSSDESQDYGDFPDLDDLEEIAQEPVERSSLGFSQTSLWHLLSNAFGAECAPDDNLLLECIDTWVLVASCQVSAGDRSWSYYVDPFKPVSWHQLRDTEQTRKFRPYFMAALLEYDSSVYEEHRLEFFNSLLSCLADRESMLRFQYRLLRALVQVDPSHPLLRNLPFYRDSRSGKFDISADTLRDRRLSLLSSILANMRDDFHTTMLENQSRAAELKRDYSALLKDFMAAMKNNYQQLRQGMTATGAYVEFVQKIVQFLNQHTSDICSVDRFFTDSVAFPLPATDPTYVVGRLCGYAPKLASAGITKQLSTFIQTVAQQAALDNQQPYLVHQLSAALSNDVDPSIDKAALRTTLLQGIFPAYIEAAISGTIGLVISRPILQALKPILECMFFDVRVADTSNVEIICHNIWSISHAFIRSTDILKDTPSLLKEPNVLQSIALVLDALSSTLLTLDYMSCQTWVSASPRKPAIVTYFQQFSVFIAEVLHDMLPSTTPTFNVGETPCSSHGDLLTFCTRLLKEGIKNNWSKSQGRVFFGQGYTRREVVVHVGTFEEEKASLVRKIVEFYGAIERIFRA